MQSRALSRRELLVGAGGGSAAAVLGVPVLGVPVLGGLGSESTVPDVRGADGLRFGIIADVHQDIMHDGERRLEAFLQAMGEANADFIVQLGDFCVPHARNDAFMKLWNSHAGRSYHVIGNHETDGGSTREQVVEYFGMPNRYYSFDESGVHFVVLDGNDRGGTSSGYPRFIADDQLAWLREDLAAGERPTVVLIHQPLDSSDGVDNRAAVRAMLEESNRTAGHANVLAVVAGHSHVDYCRVVNGIYYVLVNSASYQWVGSKYRHTSYPAEVHAKAGSLDRTCPYREPLWVVVTLDPVGRTLEIEGRSTTWVGPSPVECGADFVDGYWGWDPAYSQPRASSWRLPFAASGELG